MCDEPMTFMYIIYYIRSCNFFKKSPPVFYEVTVVYIGRNLHMVNWTSAYSIRTVVQDSTKSPPEAPSIRGENSKELNPGRGEKFLMNKESNCSLFPQPVVVTRSQASGGSGLVGACGRSLVPTSGG